MGASDRSSVGTLVKRKTRFVTLAKMDIWFCAPHAPWQQGSNENTNGLLRQFLPKGADLRRCTQQDLDHIADLRHDRPRKTLGGKTPDQALAEEIANAAKNGAIGT
jgi:transposase, IS30 family